MQRPLIGITTSVDDFDYVDGRAPFVMLPTHYSEAVRAAGGQPLLIPEGNPEGAMDVIVRLDGLLIAGGRDIDPALYGAPAHAKTTDIRRRQDDWEAALFKAAYQADLAVLGVCRGHQLMCVCAGGKLHQHLPDVVGFEKRDCAGWDCEWPVVVQPGTKLASCVGVEVGSGTEAVALLVKTANHQGVADAGALSVAARAVADGLIEAAEDPTKRFCVCVQWHPEYQGEEEEAGAPAAVVVALVDAAAQVATLRARVQVFVPATVLLAMGTGLMLSAKLMSRWMSRAR